MLTAVAAGPLDEAWARAFAAVRARGWCDLVLYHFDRGLPHEDPALFGAKTTPDGRTWLNGIGMTPTDALLDLTRQLETR